MNKLLPCRSAEVDKAVKYIGVYLVRTGAPEWGELLDYITQLEATQERPIEGVRKWPEVDASVLEIAKEITDGKVTFAYSAKNMRWWMAREIMRLHAALTQQGSNKETV